VLPVLCSIIHNVSKNDNTIPCDIIVILGHSKMPSQSCLGVLSVIHGIRLERSSPSSSTCYKMKGSPNN
jgi:hypothetical protein